MRIIVSSDWQATYENHDECVIAWEFVLKQCKDYSLEAIVLAGDLKHSYNPIDIRVIKFWFKAISKAIEKGIRVIILLGNHDREGLYTDSKNWLSILRKAGAEVFDKPGVCELINGKIGMLPFTTSNKELRKRADRLAELEWDKWNDILLFHADIKDCKYSQFGIRSSSRLKFEELHPEKYLACIGGHIHLPQEIGKNGYYVGSPFAMDWGEVNQKKSFLLVQDSDIKLINSPLPGWFDETISGYYKPKSWKRTRVRVHVEVDSTSSYKKVLEKANIFAERDYPGAIIKVVPEFTKVEAKKAKVSINDSDEQKIKSFVKETLPSDLEKYKEKIIGFLVAKLKESEGLLRHGNKAIKFIDFKGKNFLSFKKVNVAFEKQGLVLIEGTNKDWSNQSNGSGKTNYVQAIPVSLCGTTFKKQHHDRWARRQTKELAKIQLRVKVNDKIYTIIRCRHPNKLKLLVNGRDHSSGRNSTSKEGTQLRIEQSIGLTQQTLANSVYIDKSIATAFLVGTKSHRVDLLYKFQNLERFAKALSLVKKYKQRHMLVIEQTEKAIDIFEIKIEAAKSNLEESKDNVSDRIKSIKSSYRKSLVEWRVAHKKKIKLQRLAAKTYRTYKKKYDKTSEIVNAYDKQIEEVKRGMWNVDREIQHCKNLVDKKKCPTCRGKINQKKFTKIFKESNAIFYKIRRKLNKLSKLRSEYNNKCALYEGEIDQAKLEYASARDKADNLKSNLRWMKSQIAELQKQETKSIDKIKKQLTKLKTDLIEFKDYKKQLEKDIRFIDFCEEAFTKDGLPAFINAQMAPILNKACEYYSDLFCDKEVMIQFDIDEGDLVPRIVNLHGGEKTTDQSTGEASIAGLITSFALKEIAPRTNILILDEPENGLSPENIRRVAKGLLKLKDKFESIFVVTHSPILLGELPKEKIVKIEKHHSVSKVING
jgi:DNA repair exonuclease SbcCD nuclease subunit